MRSCRSVRRARRWCAVLPVIAAAALSSIVGRAELPEWARNVDADGRFHSALFRTVPMPAGPIEIRRTPADTHAALAAAAGASSDADLLQLRARVAEEKLDPAAAEADWKAYAAAVSDRGRGELALADFYHRRLKSQEEAEALAAAARAADPPADRLLLPRDRRAWRVFERLFALVDAQRLPDAFAEAQYREWMARFAQDPEPYHRFFRFLIAHDRPADSEALLSEYRQSFPADEAWLLEARAELASRRGSPADGLAVYAGAFRPSWDPGMVRAYFDLLDRTHSLRAFLDRARAEAAARPADVVPVARIFYYYQRAGNSAAAEQALADFEARRAGAMRTADELFTLATLYERTRNYNEAIRYYCSIYSLPGATAGDAERALASIIETLLTIPEQPLRFGAGDLSFYRDIASIDPDPGFLNGVLSLLFNSASPREQYARQESASVSYFHRARAAELLSVFERRFPDSARRQDLNASLIATYSAYAESDAVIARVRSFLASFPDAPQRTSVALAMADAFARKEQTSDEFATYDRLLEEVAARADKVPLGSGVAAAPESRSRRSVGARSPEYARILDQYVSRLVSRGDVSAALTVYRREIDRNPDDPGLYAALAEFLEQNDYTAEVERIYRRAIEQFPDRSWHHRLARWYLRRNQAARLEELTRDVVRAFDGTELAAYFDAVVAETSNTNARLYLQLNLYAHQRFPHHLTFVRNLLSAYTARGTRDPVAREALLRRHWFEDEALTAEFLANLSATGRLESEITEVRRSSEPPDGKWETVAKENPLATRFLAESLVWRSRFESATPVLTALAAEYPGDIELGRRAASLHRSLSYADEGEANASAEIEERIQRYAPRDVTTLTRLGEIYADREQYDRARLNWDRLIEIEPGNAASYGETATIFWDYYQFQDALRVIETGRRTLNNPALLSFEAGAINEGMRRFDRAIDEYVRGAVADEGTSPARSRLLTLAKRESSRARVDAVTAAAADAAQPNWAAVSLRISVLEAQDRRSDLERFLLTLLDRTSSLELMPRVRSEADRLGLSAVETRALARQIEVMSDPIERLELRYALVRLHESRGELDAARGIVDGVYAENPRTVGVIRQTVDYYWRHKLNREAIGVLTRAASRSYPALKRQLAFEAARKWIDVGEYAEARTLIESLLVEEPFNADYLAAVAESYARANADGQLRDFYKSTIEALRSAPLPADEKTRRTAGLRRALIPALTRLGDYPGAVDQYIEIVNRFPDDQALLREAGTYARRYGRKDQLVAYYMKAAGDSPRDYRWPMLVAQLQTDFGEFPAAIDAYSRAIAIRPDRPDFLTARGALEERLMRFDAAAASYGKAYDITYHDPRWMEKIAELRARQGQVDAASKAIRTALVDGRPPRAQVFFTAARRLEQWNLLESAASLADEGANIAAPDELVTIGGPYVAVHARLRHANALVDRLFAARDRARSALPAGADGARLESALAARLRELAEIVARDFSPEERAAFAAFLEQKKAALQTADFESELVPLAENAGLTELAVKWRTELMNAKRLSRSNEHLFRLIQLQTERLRFDELALQLESFAAPGGPDALAARSAAAEAHRKAGNTDGELRVLSQIGPFGLSAALRDRYLELLLARDFARLTALAGSGPPAMRDAVANYVVAHGTVDQALAITRARAQGMPPVWGKAYAALVGFHFGRVDAATTEAFASALATTTVGDGLNGVDRRTVLAGAIWFQYGSRFGEYLAYGRQSGADDYLEAGLESTPARSDAYVTLADFYRDQGDWARALASYEHGAALNPRRSDVHLRAAAILWRQGRRADAIGRWKEAMRVLARQAARGEIDNRPIAAVLDSIATRGLWPPLREPADQMVRASVARNGAYRAGALLRAAFGAPGLASAGTDWLLDLARAAPNQVEMLGAVATADWLPDGERDRVYERLVAVGEQLAAAQYGAAQSSAQAEIDRWRLERIRALVDIKEAARADELLRALPQSTRIGHEAEVMTLETRIAAATASLGSLLDRYSREDRLTAGVQPLTTAATALRRGGDAASARRIMEFVYTHQLDRDEPTASAFLGLAEIRIEQGSPRLALDLLRRVTLVVGEPFENLSACGALLERLHRTSDSLEFRRARARAVPWDLAAQLALARAEISAGVDRDDALRRLGELAELRAAGYAGRVEAARAFGSSGGRLGRAPRSELDWLRDPSNLTPETVGRSGFVDARLAAAGRVTDQAVRISLLKDAIAASPGHPGLRIPLFRAGLASGRAADALEALGPLLNGNRSLTRLGLSAAARSRLAREIADASEMHDQLAEAVRFLTIAVEGAPAGVRAALRQRVARLNDEIARRAANDARRPRLSESLDQPQLVRPVIPPRRAPVTAGAGAGR